MMNFDTLFLLYTFIIYGVNASVIINNFNNNCVWNSTLMKEIESYKNVTSMIIDEIVNKGLGDKMFADFTRFIDKFGPRLSGSNNLEQAIDHMIVLTKKHGLNDVFTEEVEVPHWVRGNESITMVKPRFKQIALLGLGTSIGTTPEGITAQVIVVKNFEELENLDKSKVEGKIVVYNVAYKTYGDTVIYRSQGATKAAIKGAVASLVRSITPFSIYSPHTGSQYYSNPNVTKVPTAAITIEDANLLNRHQDEGEEIIINIKMSNTFDFKKSRNTIIDLKGKENPAKSVIVSGHIDSWDVGQGAMDDGAGMMISWFTPVILNQLNLKPRRTIRAILWTAEEPGLVGAMAYLKNHLDELDKINFIMESDEGTFKPLGLEVAGSKNAQCIIALILKLFAPIDKMEVSDSPGSDITIFIRKGIPGASLLNDNYQYYWFHHSQGDTLDVLNKKDVINCGAFWTAVSYVIADLSIDIPRI